MLNKLSATYINKDKVEVVYLKNYALVRSKELLELTQKVYETCKTKMIDVNTIARFSKKWLLNTLRNISTVNNSSISLLSDLENKFIGQTALIVAAGPSLNENIEKIKANRDKFVIFAVNKVLRTLEANGITPRGNDHNLIFKFPDGTKLWTNIVFGPMQKLLKYATEKNYESPNIPDDWWK